MIKVLIVNNQRLINDAVSNLLSDEPNFAVDSIVCGKQAFAAVREKRYDVYLIDFDLLDENCMKLVMEINQEVLDAKIFIMTMNNSVLDINSFISNGVYGVIDYASSQEQLIQTIKLAMDGKAVFPMYMLEELRRPEEISLTQTEEDVLIEVSKGSTNDKIAQELHMSKEQ